RLIIRVLPSHRKRRQMPVRSSGDSGAVGVCLLMATHAIQAWHAFPCKTADDVCEVTMAIISLLRVICSSVTVNTARMSQDRIDLLPGRQSVGEPGVGCSGLAFTSLRRAQG